VVIFKADIFKAFGSVCWDFILVSLKIRGFSTKWIQWIRELVMQGYSHVVLNSIAGRKIILKSGVRQGDPILLYLFIIAMDFLSMWIKKLNEMQILKPPFQGCRSCLLYADDTLLMLRPEDSQLRILKVILHIFEKLSGLRVNLAKSELIVTNASENQVAQLAQIMNCKTAKFPIQYLRLPSSNKALTKQQYHVMIDTVEE
jgi:Reverse transcriptase (RNA-dependent DNA polymerase)